MTAFLQFRADDVELCRPLLQDAFEHIEKRSHGFWTAEGIFRRAKTCEWQVWGLFDGEALLAVVGSCLTVGDDGRKRAEILFCTGKGRDQLIEKLPVFEAWAKAEGCVRMVSIARTGWSRFLPGYRATHLFLEKEL